MLKGLRSHPQDIPDDPLSHSSRAYSPRAILVALHVDALPYPYISSTHRLHTTLRQRCPRANQRWYNQTGPICELSFENEELRRCGDADVSPSLPLTSHQYFPILALLPPPRYSIDLYLPKHTDGPVETHRSRKIRITGELSRLTWWMLADG